MDNINEVINKVVKLYFEEPDKTLKEIFGEYTEDLTQEETEQFYANLKTIIN